jgi:hypothetical protein
MIKMTAPTMNSAKAAELVIKELYSLSLIRPVVTLPTVLVGGLDGSVLMPVTKRTRPLIKHMNDMAM